MMTVAWRLTALADDGKETSSEWLGDVDGK
jgi:hypothetical protein